ncbi:NAD(P)-binding oxidoreductase [Sorangium sp. So ce281]|uniref:NAD(P)-dependent oxidoreductase n=1 Tax=unclassified Sorangium TaxID=2621164 RepID=UPI003F5E1ABE
MRIFVVGANGRLGQRVVAEALRRGHEITAFVRDPGAIVERPGLSVRIGAVADEPARVREAIAGHDAVLSALGNPLWLKGKRGPAIVAAAAGNLVAAMREQGISRIVMPLAWGTGQSNAHASPLVRAAIRILIRRDYRDFDAAEEILARSGLAWTVAYFGRLTDAAPSSGWSVSAELRAPGQLAIARDDVAQFLVSAAQDDAFAGRRVVLSGASRRGT